VSFNESEKGQQEMVTIRTVLALVISATILCALAVAQQSIKYGMDLVNELRDGAAKGAFGAAHNLGIIYAKGLQGIPKDNIQAYMWFDIATDFTNAHSADMSKPSQSKELAQLQESRRTISKNMTPAQIAEAKQLAIQWKSKHPEFSSTSKVAQRVTPPKPLFTPLAPYTEDARKAGVEGSVTLNCTIHKDGLVDNCKVMKGLGYGLDEAAVRTVITKWRFEPAIYRGEKIDTPAAGIEMTFKLLKK
jgi:TonB family protein